MTSITEIISLWRYFLNNPGKLYRRHMPAPPGCCLVVTSRVAHVDIMIKLSRQPMLAPLGIFLVINSPVALIIVASPLKGARLSPY